VSFARKVARRALRKELKKPGIGNQRVICKEHGKKPWRGDLVCGKCGKIHFIVEETGEHPSMPDDVCPCGAIMFPVRNEAGELLKDIPFFGRVACRQCALAEAEKQKNAEADAKKLIELKLEPP